ncbi:MAG: flavodoxin family protein [Candidatus Saliniplasma sp.]
MEALVVYYSRNGTTRKLAEVIANKLDGDIEEIVDNKSRRGSFKYLKSGFEALRCKIEEINDPKKDPADYDIVILGTPVWAHRMSTPLRSYLHRMKDRIDEAAFFCTYDMSGSKSTFSDMSKVLSLSPISKLALKSVDFEDERYDSKLDRFVSEILDYF